MPSFFTRKPIRAVFAAGFLFAFHTALTTYINSTYISDHTARPGILYAVSAALMLAGFFSMPRLLARFGNRKMALALASVSIASLAGMAFLDGRAVIIPLFVAYLAANTLIFYCLDIFLEEYSSDESTGTIRGSYLTNLNMAWLFAPAIVGFILSSVGYGDIYSIGILLLAPVFFIFKDGFAAFKDPAYQAIPVVATARAVAKDKNVRKIYASAFMLQFLYSAMTIFMPIYLREHIGFEWSTIGLIFTIMLLPFVLLERPLGIIADKRLGEKEMLSAGFIIAGLFTIGIAFLDTANPFVWALMLFMTRVGAASIEVMNDSYFFKHVDSSDAGIIGFFRSATPLAYIVSPMLATAALGAFSYQALFIGLGLATLTGLIWSLRIEDTK